MKTIVTVSAIALSLAISCNAFGQSVDDLLKDHTLLRSELERCVHMGMESNDDARCKTARAAEQKRFFGGGVGYTPKPVDVFPNHAVLDPQPNSQKSPPPSKSGPPNGQ